MTAPRPLLTDYLTKGSEQAFRELDMCYLSLVYSTGMSLVNSDMHRAEKSYGRCSWLSQ